MSWSLKCNSYLTAKTTSSGWGTELLAGVNVALLGVFVVGTTPRTGGDPYLYQSGNNYYFTQAYAQQSASGGEGIIELWYMINPPLTPAGSLSLFIPNSGSAYQCYVIAGFQASNGSPEFHSASGNNWASVASYGTSHTASEADELIVGACYNGLNSFVPTSQTGTAINNTDVGNYGYGMQYLVSTGAGTVQSNWSCAGADDAGAIGAMFKNPSGGGGGGGLEGQLMMLGIGM